jgi:hypothetical protein
MFEKTSKLAEKVATSMSRRHFFTSLGRWSGATALAMAGVLATAGSVRAASKTCCTYGRSFGIAFDVCGVKCVPAGSACPTTLPRGCSSTDYLLNGFSVPKCGDCGV